jgi:hypothetical protein
MKFAILRKSIIFLIILTPLIIDLGCKKQKKCGCGKDVIFTLTLDADRPYIYANVYYTESSKTAYFYSSLYSGSTFYFCNPGKWMDLLKTFTSGQELLVSGNVFYECNYLMNSGNYGYYVPPVYQVDVTDVKKNNYGKK